ncbi:hypothetical protein KY316_03125, partial [Candidatus Woesearchaeota archaeon]|nr:hypothetical protein [Candidatus Woesearchaeota archaeon]
KRATSTEDRAKIQEYSAQMLANSILARGLNINPELLDGDASNGEIREIVISKVGEVGKEKYVPGGVLQTLKDKKIEEKEIRAELSEAQVARYLAHINFNGNSSDDEALRKAREHFFGLGYSEKLEAYALVGASYKVDDTNVSLTARVSEENKSIRLTASDGKNSASVHYKKNDEEEIGVGHSTDYGKSSDIRKLRLIEKDGKTIIVPEVSKVVAGNYVAIGAGAEHNRGVGVFGTIALVKNKDASGANDVVRTRLMSEDRDYIDNTQNSVSTELNLDHNNKMDNSKVEVVQYLPRHIAVFGGTEGTLKGLSDIEKSGYTGLKFSLSTFCPNAEVTKIINPGIRFEFKDGKFKIYPTVSSVNSSQIDKLYDY